MKILVSIIVRKIYEYYLKVFLFQSMNLFIFTFLLIINTFNDSLQYSNFICINNFDVMIIMHELSSLYCIHEFYIIALN